MSYGRCFFALVLITLLLAYGHPYDSKHQLPDGPSINSNPNFLVLKTVPLWSSMNFDKNTRLKLWLWFWQLPITWNIIGVTRTTTLTVSTTCTFSRSAIAVCTASAAAVSPPPQNPPAPSPPPDPVLPPAPPPGPAPPGPPTGPGNSNSPNAGGTPSNSPNAGGTPSGNKPRRSPNIQDLFQYHDNDVEPTMYSIKKSDNGLNFDIFSFDALQQSELDEQVNFRNARHFVTLGTTTITQTMFSTYTVRMSAVCASVSDYHTCDPIN